MRSICLQYLLAFGFAFGVISASAPKGKWDSFNFAPSSKTVYPTAIHSTNGSVKNADLLVNNKGAATLSGNGSWLALDFGGEVGGLISLNFDSVTSTSALALSFTESPTFIRPTASDDSSYPAENTTFDGVLRVTAPLPKGHWAQPANALRGGFRYLTLVSNSDAPLTISNVSCAISFMPHVDDLRAYAGYFYTPDDELLTKIWYSGAYTVQTNTVPLNTGRMVPFSPPGSWANNATLGVAGPIIVDGAKRDRAVWPGDMGIAVPTQFVSTNDLIPTRNALSTMFAAINPKTGALPESGPPLSQQGSDTYHAWTLIGTYNYFLYSGDLDWLQTVWANYTKAVAFLEGKVDSTGLMDVTGLRDWARQGGGGYNAEGNAILYKVLTTASELASHVPNTTLSSAWAQNATALKQTFNTAFWLESAGMYRDNATTTLCPQDANSFAVLFNLTLSQSQKTRVSEGLTVFWNDIGPVAPELPDTISPFIAGFEIQAHFEAGNATRALDLIRRTWGYMLATPLSVQSTLLEGFTANGSLAYRWYRGYNNDPSYTSHAHGWSSGPTSALTFYILGLTITAPQGRTWSIAPNVESSLSSAQGGFTTPLGWFGVQWTTSSKVKDVLILQIDTPTGTSGTVKLPSGAVKGASKYVVDGVPTRYADGQAVEIQLRGGKHTVVFQK
ncbi:Six-hairpin glycosidase [Pholiota conissans]|uniref:Six-hairpin glycosidase n=1 Tax=Pholiota conissans TaxID=109636 RepID=A0A9P5YX99_9AGAR|nr:Six-hairpin glycosidase [Pholiota conissans]